MLHNLINMSISRPINTLYIYRGILMFEILERAKQFARDAKEYISSIVGSDNETKPAQSSKKGAPNCVHNPENKTVDKPIDKFVKQPVNDSKKNTKTDKNITIPAKHNKSERRYTNVVTDEDIVKKGKEIDKFKKEYEISDEEYYEIILPRVGYTRNEFRRLNNNDKMRVLDIISGAMKLFALDKYKDNPDINMTDIIADAAADFKKANMEGGVGTFREFDKAVKPYIAKINKEFKSAKSEDEKIEVLINNRLAFEADVNKQRTVELAYCKTVEERAEVNRKYDKRIEAFEGYIQTHFIADNGSPNNAFISTHLRKSDDMVNGYERAVKSFSHEARCTAAGTFTHDNRIKQAQRYAELGDPISATTFGAATEVVTQYMNKADAEQYEADAYKFKQEYYKNPGKYKFISEEHLTNETAALAVGVALNKNMSASEKAAFMRVWNEHAQQFSDYDSVREKFYTAVKEYLTKHPEAKQGIEDIKTKYREQYGDNPDIPRVAKKRYEGVVSIESKNEKNLSKKSDKQTGKATSQQLERALVTYPYDEVRRQYSMNSDRDFAEVVLHNPKLKNHKQNIVGYIKSLSADNLSNLTKGCSTEMFLFVLRNISPDKAGRLYDLSKGEKCYAARKLGEEIVEENRANEVA